MLHPSVIRRACPANLGTIMTSQGLDVARSRGRRATEAFLEVVIAVVLGGVAWWCWQRGVTVTVRRGVGMSDIEGGWWATATVAATLAGILLLDAGRRAMATP
ncbi:MAG: hypothetical protein ACRDSH_15120 [Pseudonocardiaceae bacterium]